MVCFIALLLCPGIDLFYPGITTTIKITLGCLLCAMVLYGTSEKAKIQVTSIKEEEFRWDFSQMMTTEGGSDHEDDKELFNRLLRHHDAYIVTGGSFSNGYEYKKVTEIPKSKQLKMIIYFKKHT